MKLLIRIISLLIVISIMFSTVANAVTFSDISDHWAKSYIEKVADKGIVTGFSDRTFRPNDNVTVLQALLMMSRLYDIDEDISDVMFEEHEPLLEDMSNILNYEWAFEELSRVLGLNIVTENAMEQMFENKTVFQPATKEEIAVLLTKAMMLEDEVKNLKSYILPYNDISKITEKVRPYIYVMYDKEIIKGDNNKNINPQNNITRAEMSTMLDRAYEYITDNNIEPNLDNYLPSTTINGIVTEIEEGDFESYITVTDYSDNTNFLRINKDTKIYRNNKLIDVSDLKTDMIVTCKSDINKLAIKINVDSSSEIVRGLISFVAFSPPAKITITDEDDDLLSYDVPSDALIYLNGKEVELKKLKEDDEITLILKDKKINQIYSISRIKKYDGKITDINYNNLPIKITIKTDTDKIMTFDYTNDVEITRNDEDSSFDQVRVGDNVTVKTEYDDLLSLNTIAAEAELSGTIKEILIAPQIKIKIADVDGNLKEYAVSNNVKINIGDKNATIYDLRLGYHVDVNTSGEEIVTIEASELETAKSFSGKVIYINTDDKLIMMQNIKENGQTELVYISITNSTKIFNTSGNTKYLKDIEEGNNIMIYALSMGGENIAITIILQ